MGVKFLPYTGVDDGQPRLREEQETSIQRMMWEMQHGTKSVLCGSNMDTGKTVQACELAIRLGFQRVLYVGVKDTFDQWKERLALQSDGAIELRRMDSSKAGQQAFADFRAGHAGHFFVGAQYLTTQDWTQVAVTDPATKRTAWKVDKVTGAVITQPNPGVGPQDIPVPQKVRAHLRTYKKMKVPVDLLVFDEIHMVANRKSNGARTLASIPTAHKLGMSGTTFGNKFENAWSLTRWLWPTLIDTAFSRWRAEWCSVETPTLRNGKPMTDSRGAPLQAVTGEKEPGAFVASLPCYVRIDGEVKVPEPEIVYVDLTPEQRADYEALERDGMVWLQAHPALEPLVTNLPVTKRTRLRQATLGVLSFDPDGAINYADDCQSTKLFALRGIVDRPDWRGRQVGIYCDSKRFVKITVKRMRAAGYNAVEWSGDLPSKQRDEIKRAFLAGEIQYLVSVIRSFSTGLDGFQTVCNRVVWLSEDDNNVANEQAIKRYCRSGNDEMLADFQHVKIVARGTYDEGVWQGNVVKSTTMGATLKAA